MNNSASIDPVMARMNECLEGAELASRWVETFPDILGDDKSFVEKQTRKTAFRLKALLRTFGKNTAVGIFGPSQVGKSYLVSALTRGHQGTPCVVIGKESYDFIDAINPVGSAESTGVVTRFTRLSQPVINAGFPVFVRLLSEIDVIKIIANCYVFELSSENDEKERLDYEQILLAIKEAASQPGVDAKVSSPISAEQVYDLEDYAQTRFQQSGLHHFLETKSNYWSVAADVLPNAPTEDRLNYYALLWNHDDHLTALARHLLGGAR